MTDQKHVQLLLPIEDVHMIVRSLAATSLANPGWEPYCREIVERMAPSLMDAAGFEPMYDGFRELKVDGAYPDPTPVMLDRMADDRDFSGLGRVVVTNMVRRLRALKQELDPKPYG